VDCVLLTSANAARHAGPQLAAFTHLPCFAVGEISAAAARSAGLTDVRTGNSDGAALFELAAAAGMERPLHLSGRDYNPLDHPRLKVERRIAYASEGVRSLPGPAVDALRSGAIALLHSPRAGALFGDLIDCAGLDRRTIPIAALSKNVAAAAGPGWKTVAIAERPSDDALLELAAKLCQTGGSATGICG
jgi:uroporphyrinogen-III synthase